MLDRVDTSRRTFLKIMGAGGALTIAASRLGAGAALAGTGTADAGPVSLGFYVRIGADNSITIGTPSAELGQGSVTGIPMLIAEELDVDFSAVTTELIPPPLAVEGGRLKQLSFIAGAGGSAAIARSYDPARQAGALARHLLVQAAAQRLRVPADTLTTDGGRILHKASGRSLTYGAVAADAASLPAPAEPLPLKPRDGHRVIGRPQPQKDAHAIATGAPLYGIDRALPGMLNATVVHCPFLGGKVKRIDDAAARAVPGVRAVIHLPGPADGLYIASTATTAEGVAIVADRMWQALKAREVLTVEWEPGPQRESSEARRDRGWAMIEAGEGAQMVRDTGGVDQAFAQAARVMEARYEFPFAAHVTMEPPNAIAAIADGRLTIIGCTQLPTSFLNPVFAKLAGVDQANVDYVPVRAGGGFGRRLFPEVMAEAVVLARRMERPVKVLWTREDDIALDPVRPDGCHRVRAALDGQGRITAWSHQLANQFQLARWLPIPPDREWSYELHPDVSPGALVGAQRVEWFRNPSSLPHGAWRAPGHLAAAWAHQSFLDEIAHATGRDPLAFRLDLLEPAREIKANGPDGANVFDTGRLAAVLRLAAEKADWGSPLPTGRGRGIACHFAFGTYVAHVVEVTVADGDFRVDRVVSAIDCGIAVNPAGIVKQNEGGINDALSAARGQEITVRDGRVQQSNFHDYAMMRMDRAATRIETHIMPSDAAPRGMGEPPLPPLTPALCNALFAATGKRIRRLPIADQLA